MKEIIEQVDRLLGMIPVSGDAVFIMAEARKALGAAYQAEQKKKEEREA